MSLKPNNYMPRLIDKKIDYKSQVLFQLKDQNGVEKHLLLLIMHHQLLIWMMKKQEIDLY